MWSYINSLVFTAAGFGPASWSSDAQPSLALEVPRHQGPLAHGGTWATGFDKAKHALADMTLAEKINLTSAVVGPCQGNSGGVPRLGIPGMCFNDGPSGPRHTDFITQFPSAFTAAASFDRELIEERATRIGQEFRGKGVNVELGPVVGGPLGRSPYGGRNWEAFTPDPYLASTMAYLTIKGMQSSGLITCTKHFIAYEQQPVCSGPLKEDGGPSDCDDVSSDVDDKTLHELYMLPFAEAVRAGSGSMMCSYNRINGTYTCENNEVQNKLLKEELGFQGFVVSDFAATHSTVPTVNGGMDMELPEVVYYGKNLEKAVEKDEISVTRIDDMVLRILTPWYAHGQDKDYPAPNYQQFNLDDEVEVDGTVFRNQHVNTKGDNYLLARKVATESTVLLKNNGILPLKGVRRIGVFGSDADYPSTLSGCGPDLFCHAASNTRYWNGTVTIGGGSGAAYPDYVAAPIEAISLRARREGMRVDQVLKDDAVHYDTMRIIARQSEVCLAFVSLFLVEGLDRPNLRLDKGGEEMIKVVEKDCAGPTVVVLHIGGQVVMEDWIDLPNIGGVIYAGYPGQETGNALVEILWGDANPSAKLPFTIGKQEKDWPSDIIRKRPKDKGSFPRKEFSEGVSVDYKWFDQQKIAPRFEFGFGLSYTTFEMSALNVRETYVKDVSSIQKTNERYEGSAGLYDVLYIATANVTNTGKIAGAEVAQLYLSFPSSEERQPPRHLRGYVKPYLLPGQSKVVNFPLRKKDLAVWDVEKQQWRIPEGDFTFRVGHSSKNLPLKANLKMKEKR